MIVVNDLRHDKPMHGLVNFYNYEIKSLGYCHLNVLLHYLIPQIFKTFHRPHPAVEHFVVLFLVSTYYLFNRETPLQQMDRNAMLLLLPYQAETD